MKVLCTGAGPAGLYLAILLRAADEATDVTIFDRRPPGGGWGVTIWDDLLTDMSAVDPVSAASIAARSVQWHGQTVRVQGRPAVQLGGGGHSIARQELCEILLARARSLGVHMRTGSAGDDEISEADVVVVSDGSASTLRRRHAAEFGTRVRTSANMHIWLGTRKVFDSFTYAFAHTSAGWVWFYGYAFDGFGSTCVVECSRATWTALGLAEMPAAGVSWLDAIFERELDGQPLLTGRERRLQETRWTSFEEVRNARWHHGKLVLLGDAAHTTHFTIGSGTHLAIHDAIGLASALRRHGSVPAALRAYGSERRRLLRPWQIAAGASARWFEQIDRYIDLDPLDFALALDRRRSPVLPHVNPRNYCDAVRMAKRSALLRAFAQRTAAGLPAVLPRRA